VIDFANVSLTERRTPPRWWSDEEAYPYLTHPHPVYAAKLDAAMAIAAAIDAKILAFQTHIQPSEPGKLHLGDGTYLGVTKKCIVIDEAGTFNIAPPVTPE
jgi:hypothetical protein